jgi:tetratricopeptide (TPR) repeat protein
MKKIILIIVLLLTSYPGFSAGLYKCEKEDGTISYQQRKCENTKPDMLTSKGITDSKSYQQSLHLQDGSLGEYTVKMLTFNWWKGFKKEVSPSFLHFKFTDDSGDTNISLLIDFIIPKKGEKINQSYLIDLLKKASEPLKKTSLEQVFKYQTMKTQEGFGYNTTFTDANLVDKKSYPPGEYLHTTKGFMYINEILVHFTLLSDDKEAQNHIFALQFMANGIAIEKQDKSKIDQSLLDQAYNAYYEGAIKDAVILFEKLIKEEPESFKAWIGYCLSLRDSNRLQKGFIACDKALQLRPNDPDVLNSILNILNRARLFEQSLVLAKKLINISVKKQVIDTINNLGFYAMLDGKLGIAQQAFSIVKKESGANQKVLLDEAMLAYIKKDSKKALNILEGMLNKSEELDSILNDYINAINNNEIIYPNNANYESYTIIPQRLQNIGSGELVNQQVDPWVTKVFPIVGIGKLQLQVPEDWFEGVQHKELEKNLNSLSLILSEKSLKESIVRIEVGKVSKEWNVYDLSNQMLAGLKAQLPKNSIKLKPLGNNRKGYKFEDTLKVNSVTLSYLSTNELFDNISLEINSESFNNSNERTETIKRIVNSIQILEQDYTPLSNYVSKKTNKLAVGVRGDKPANEMELPEAPSGFNWVRMPLAQAAFVKPDGWFENHIRTKNSVTYTISKEKADENTDLETGLTLIAIENLKSKNGMSPMLFSLGMVKEIEKSPDDTIIEMKDISQGPLFSILVKYENHPLGLKPNIIHKVLTANDETGSLYMILFEAPKESWDDAWKYGEVMMKYFLLDDEF